MRELLLEVGCEELPASFVAGALNDLREAIVQRLTEAGLIDVAEPQEFATPRRLIVSIEGVRDRQLDRSVEQRGPALQAAFGSDGEPTQALLGFCRSQGVELESLRKDEKYVWADKVVPGRTAIEVLAELLPSAIRSVKFEKSMRWGSSKMRFARPIRWLLACFGGQVVPFEVEGVRSSDRSRGHRFYANEPFEACTLNDLLAGLRSRFVEPCPDLRRMSIEQDGKRAAQGYPDLSEALVDENVFLTEWPTAIQGEFSQEFESLPEPVLITAMAKHEKCFPVRDADGRLTNRFIAIRNSGEDDSVRRGYEWVLNARFNDAKFFFDEDSRSTMDDFLGKTESILFQEKLGTVRARADRLSKLSAVIAEHAGASVSEVACARQAGLYAKADLSTGLVGELASLQGIIGAEYGKREGFETAVCDAIRSQYSLKHTGSLVERSLFIADALDKLAGYLGLGLTPTGSSDPFGLRRAATGLIEGALTMGPRFPSYAKVLSEATGTYAEDGVCLDGENACRLLCELFASRYEAIYEDLRHDVLAAAILQDEPDELLWPTRVATRLKACEKLADDVGFVQTATRPANIVEAAIKKGVHKALDGPSEGPNERELDSNEGAELLNAVKTLAPRVEQAVLGSNVDGLIASLLELKEPVNRFFDSTMVMAEVDQVRTARLRLLESVNRLLRRAGDFTKIVIEG